MKPILKNLLLAGASLSVPASLYALSDPSYFEVSVYGLIGSANTSGYSGTLAVGFNNLFSGFSGGGTAVIGTSLRAYYSNCLVVGKFNSTSLGASPLFIVGNGNDANTRKNALEVWGDGTVYMPQGADIKKVPARGGISMGDFTATAP